MCLCLTSKQESDNDTVINLRAYGGQILIQGCKVRSFDRSRNNGRGGADKDPSDGRRQALVVGG